MSADTQTRKRLSEAEMDTVLTAARNDWSQGVVAVFKCFGVDLTDPDGPRISPSDYAIPADQWGEIAQACAGDSDSSIGKVNHMMDWMNYAPSGYEAEGEQ